LHLSTAALDHDDLVCSAGAGLTLNFTAGRVAFAPTVVTDVAAGSIAMTDNTTNFVYVIVTGTVTKNTTGFPVGCYPLAIVTTSGGAITVVQDQRAYLSVATALHAALASVGANDHHNTVTIGADGQHSLATQVLSGVAASLTQVGHVEIATAAETTTGTDAGRAVSPDGLAGSDYGKRVVGILVSDPGGDAITTGDGKMYFRVPSVMNGWNLVGVAMSLTTASSSGIPTVQIRNSTQAADMLTTKLTIDANETDSSTAAAAAVIDTANDDVATGDKIHIDIDVAGTGAKGLFVEMVWQLP